MTLWQQHFPITLLPRSQWRTRNGADPAPVLSARQRVSCFLTFAIGRLRMRPSNPASSPRHRAAAAAARGESNDGSRRILCLRTTYARPRRLGSRPLKLSLHVPKASGRRKMTASCSNSTAHTHTRACAGPSFTNSLPLSLSLRLPLPLLLRGGKGLVLYKCAVTLCHCTLGERRTDGVRAL